MINLRFTRRLFSDMQTRLRRPHPHAAERVGFVYGRCAELSDKDVLIVLSKMVDVDDADYEHDDSVGARIGPTAIRKALQYALDNRAAGFHVHLHDHVGTPWFSDIDLDELPGVVRPLGVLVPTQPYGMLLMSADQCIGMVWCRRDLRPSAVNEVRIVGAPLTMISGSRRDR